MQKKNGSRKPKNFESAAYWLNKAYKLRDACKEHNISLKKSINPISLL